MVLSREELEEVAGILRDFPRVVAISDEVSVPAVDGRVPNSVRRRDDGFRGRPHVARRGRTFGRARGMPSIFSAVSRHGSLPDDARSTST
jgi:hypothetical protein